MKVFANRLDPFSLIFHLLNPRRCMRMPLADLPIACCSRPVCRFGRLVRLGVRFLPLLSLLRLLRFLRFLVLFIAYSQSHHSLVKSEA